MPYPCDPSRKAHGASQDAAQAITREFAPWSITFDYGATNERVKNSDRNSVVWTAVQ
jgi:hypothetical protein